MSWNNAERRQAQVTLAAAFICTAIYTYFQGGQFLRLVYQQVKSFFPGLLP